MADGQAILEPLDVDIDAGGGQDGNVDQQGQDNSQGQDNDQQQQQLSPEEQQKKSSREYQKWLNGMKETSPEHKPFINRAKDNESRLYALGQIEPRGIDGVRETYAAIQAVQHGDLTGIDAVQALQDTARDVELADQMIANGDPAIWEQFGEEFNEGLAKLAPSLLDRVAQADPEAYQAAILPHMVGLLAKSDVVASFNSLVDVMEQQPPSYLTDQQKAAFRAEQWQKAIQLAAKMGEGFNGLAKKAGELPKQGQGAKPGGQQKADPAAERLKEAEKKEQDFHWKTNIVPQTDKHADTKFNELFRPYDKRLRLDPAAKTALKTAFVQAVVKNATKPGPNGQPNPYVKQMGRYRASKNPDPGSVLNYFKVEFDKHARTALEGLVKERYGRFLNSKPAQQQQSSAAGQKRGPVGPNVQVVSVKPTNIDYKNTPMDWIHQDKYRTTDGKVVQVRR